MSKADEQLVAAVRAKDAKGTKAALAAGASPSAKHPSGEPALFVALQMKSKALAKTLLDAGADAKATNKHDETALHVVAESFPDLDIAERLIKAGVDPNALSGRDRVAPLHVAVMRPKLDLAALLLDRGAEIDVADGDDQATPLHHTIKKDSDTSLKAAVFLIERGADVNARDDIGQNALTVAVRATRTRSSATGLPWLKQLAAAGAKLVVTEYGTLLHFAVGSTHAKDREVWDWLLERGVDIDARDRDGNAAVFEAQSSHNLGAVKYLIEKGADLSIKNNQGKTVLDEAIALKQTEIIFTLEKAAK